MVSLTIDSQFLAVMSKDATNTCVQVFYVDITFRLLGINAQE